MRNAWIHGWVAGWLLMATPVGTRAQTTRPTATTSNPTAVAQRIDLPSGGFYCLRIPSDYREGDRAPLVLCLHGTDDLARDTVAFWAGCGFPRGAIWAAPQSSGHGWSESDLLRLRETWADLQKRVTLDPDRVLLAGFSAGGAMAFHWLYREAFPATAVVTLANYLPPGVTAEHVAKRKQIPVFYGVGMEDLNHERMRVGLALLRSQGVRVTLVRPPIGHMLSPDVGREAVAWFDQLCRDATRRRLDEALEALHHDAPDRPTASGRAAVEAERVLSQARWHDADNAKRAETLLAQALVWGRERLALAGTLAATDRRESPQAVVEAIACLREIERAYAGASLAAKARAGREAIEADPDVRQTIAEENRRRREQEAMSLYLDVQRLVAAGKHDEARQACETIMSGYGETPAAQRARTLLPKLPRRIRQ